MRQLPLPGADRRRRRLQEVLYAVTAERIAVAEDNLAGAQTRIDIIRAAAAKAGLPFTSKGESR